jgi:hypothetical protein
MSIPQLTHFYVAIKEDNRISATHISLYMALFIRWQDTGFEGPVCFRRTEVMEAAKINGIATYHKCIKDLADFGYIRYMPSYNPAISNRAYLLE